MAFNARYKIPRKRKITLIIYNDRIFQTEDELRSYLKDEKGFSDMVANMAITNIPVVTRDEMESILKSLKVRPGNRADYLTGVVYKKPKK
jgi:hypothetical protein